MYGGEFHLSKTVALVAKLDGGPMELRRPRVFGPQTWMNSFPASSFHFVDYEEIKRDPWAVLDGMLEFLGMPVIPAPQSGQKIKVLRPVSSPSNHC